jgi:hypothetical protein
MPGSPQSIPPLDLDHFSEGTRRRLYDHLRKEHFFIPGSDPEDAEKLPYTAEDAGLSVLFVCGRWLAIWTRLEVETFRPEAERIEVLRIKPTKENMLGVMLHEV